MNLRISSNPTQVCLVFLTVLAMGASCSPVLYGTQGQNVPLLQSEKDVHLSGGVSATDESEGQFVQGAIAITERMGIMGSYYTFKKDGGGWNARAEYSEFAVGRIIPMESSKWLVEVYAGMGYASIENFHEGDYIDVKYSKFFIQPSLGYVGRWWELALTSRIAHVKYGNHSYQFVSSSDQLSAERFFEAKDRSLVLEPGITLRVGPPYLKLQLQYVSTSFQYEDEMLDLVDENFLSVGLAFNWRKYEKRDRSKKGR